jgi:crotonobetainyl-CoA:carnitine CoA-transferase CaiB-like acyl-CoA transferase
MYPVFCRLLGAEELATDPRFDNNTKRVENRDQLMPLLEKKMRRKALNEWLEVFEKAGIPCGPILDLREVFSDPNIAARELLLPVEHPVEGTVHLLGFPYRLSETPPRARLHPPLLGEQTADILMQQLGFSQTRIDQLQAENVL